MYFRTKEINILDKNDSEIIELYSTGFVFTRTSKGDMIQTRSLRIDLSKFKLTSENKRIINKTESLEYEMKELPLDNYSWEIHKLGKDFYTRKFGDKTMSAMKIKEMFTEIDKSNMTNVLSYTLSNNEISEGKIGYCLCYINEEIIHYAYPFYNLDLDYPNLGLGMMIRAILWAQENNKKYIYLGSIVESSSKYKLQFEGLEWWDNQKEKWSQDIDEVKKLLI